MRRALVLLMLFLGMVLAMRAQAYEGMIEYEKMKQPVALIELPYPSSVVQDAIKDYMVKKGIKSFSSGGFTLYKAAKLDHKDSVASDLYFKFERKSRNQKEVTVITLLASQTNEPIEAISMSDIGKMDKAIAYLNRINSVMVGRGLTIQTVDQEEVLKKTRKKSENLANDQTDMEKRARKLQADLDQNKIDGQKQADILQDNIHQDESAREKAHTKLDHLLDEKGSLLKKLRKTQSDLEQNKMEQEKQNLDLEKQQQQLDSLKAKKTTGF